MEVSRLDVLLCEFDNVRKTAARSRQDGVHDGVVLPENQRRKHSLRIKTYYKLTVFLCLVLRVKNHTFFQHFFAICQKTGIS